MARVLDSVRRHSDIPIAIQLAHSGRKASCELPWNGGKQIAPDARNGWQILAPSAVSFTPDENLPVMMDRNELNRIVQAFAMAAKRADRLGIDAIQLHGAHGYLLHEFLSPLSNRRDDDYGGSLTNRMRFSLEVFDAVRSAFPANKPVTMRVSGSDWVGGGGPGPDHRFFPGAGGSRMRCYLCFERREFARPEDSRRTQLSGSARSWGKTVGRDSRHRGRAYHRIRTSGGDHGHG
jgi:2,4-dienoyl-CoA reductase-like NADH-dependent reductase (Old Yellow Enzyme family)